MNDFSRDHPWNKYGPEYYEGAPVKPEAVPADEFEQALGLLAGLHPGLTAIGPMAQAQAIFDAVMAERGNLMRQAKESRAMLERFHADRRAALSTQEAADETAGLRAAIARRDAELLAMSERLAALQEAVPAATLTTIEETGNIVRNVPPYFVYPPLNSGHEHEAGALRHGAVAGSAAFGSGIESAK